MALKAIVKPEMITWARERAGKSFEDLLHKKELKKLPQWEKGEDLPTIRQLSCLAKAVHVPLGRLYTDDTSEQNPPLPDFRTTTKTKKSISLDLSDTLDICQERFQWYAVYCKANNLTKKKFVGSAKLTDKPSEIAKKINNKIGFEIENRKGGNSYEGALRDFINKTTEAGILVMKSGIVGSNTNRPLNPDEFLGFAFADSYAPLIFINGADYKSRQIFTLAHELAHIWLGKGGISDADGRQRFKTSSSFSHNIERWCDNVATEILVPANHFKELIKDQKFSPKLLEELRKQYKVSRLMMLRRFLDVGKIKRNVFETKWNQEIKTLKSIKTTRKVAGGNFYDSTISRVSKPFARAVIISTLEANTTYLKGSRLLGLKNINTFQKLAEKFQLS